MKKPRRIFSLVSLGIIGVVLSLMGTPEKPTPIALNALMGTSTFLVAGDSITAAGSHTVATGQVGEASWINFVHPDAELTGLSWVGGWAMGGAQTGDMVRALKHASADTLVLLAGTNDLAHHQEFAQIATNLRTITTIVTTNRVLLSSVPPRDDAAALTIDYNSFLRALATEEGWLFVDASAGLRTAQGTFKPGLSDDGVHPTLAGAEILGQAIGEALTDIPVQANGPSKAPNV